MTDAPRRGPGRPRSEDPRSHHVDTRWTAAELAELDTLAERWGLDRGATVRLAIRSEAAIDHVRPRKTRGPKTK